MATRTRERRGSIVTHAVLALFSLYIALPPLWVLRTSFVPEAQSYSIDLMPAFTLDNYVKLLVKDKFWLAYADSLAAATISTLLALPLAAMAGYAFARYRTGGNASRFVILATQMLPPVAIVLPVMLGYGYLEWRGWSLNNNASYDAYKLFAVFHPLLLIAFCPWLYWLRERG